MWQHLFLQNFFSVFDSSLFCHSRLSSSGTNEVQSHVLLLDHKSFVQRWLHLQHSDIPYDITQTTCSVLPTWSMSDQSDWPFPSSQGHQSHKWCVPGCLCQTQSPALWTQWWWELPVWCTAAWRRSFAQSHSSLLPEKHSVNNQYVYQLKLSWTPWLTS